MGAARSWRPPAPGQVRAKPLPRSVVPLSAEPSYRAKGTPKGLKPERAEARRREQVLLSPILGAVSIADIAERFGSPGSTVQGSQLRAGGQPMTPGELTFLLPFTTAIDSLLALIAARLEEEQLELLRDPDVRGDNARLRSLQLARVHLDALNIILSGL